MPREQMCFKGHSNNVWGMDFSSDGRFLATGSFDKTLRLWRVQPCKDIGPFKEGTSPTGQSLSPSSIVTGIVFFGDERGALTGSGNGQLGLWEASRLQFDCDSKAIRKRCMMLRSSADGRGV